MKFYIQVYSHKAPPYFNIFPPNPSNRTVYAIQTKIKPENLGCDGDTGDGYSGASLSNLSWGCKSRGPRRVKSESESELLKEKNAMSKFQASTSNEKFTLCLQIGRKQEAFEFFGIKTWNSVEVYMTALTGFDWGAMTHRWSNFSVIVLESSIDAWVASWPPTT